MGKTKAPGNITFSRSGEKLTIKWKIGDADYGAGQEMQYKLNTSSKAKWKNIPKGVGKTQTSKNYTIERDKFYPNGSKPDLPSISFRIRGKRKKYKDKKDNTIKPTWSEWTRKVYDLKAPPKPSLSAAFDSELTNKGTFTWSVNASDTNTHMYTRTRIEHVLSSGTNAPNWKNATVIKSTARSGSIPITENSVTVASGSHTRYMRARAEGPSGNSAWSDTKKLVYARPNRAKDVTPKTSNNKVGGIDCSVSWSVGQGDGAYPIDKTIVEHAIIIPAAGLTCPSGASWTEADVIADTAGKDASSFSIDDVLSDDECLFVRVNTQHGHESIITYGSPVLARVGVLAMPTDLAIEPDSSTHRIEVTATNNSSVPDSFLVVQYRPASTNTVRYVGIIPHGEDTVTVQCPNWDNESSFQIGVFAAVGSYTNKTTTGGVGSYSVNAKMSSSSSIWVGGAIALAPRNVTVNTTDTSGTIRVGWSWTWADADSAIISWADHEDAWESTDEPTEYTIKKIHASGWNISGLETGKTWYVRVRLAKGEDPITYSPWSDIQSIDLSSAPSIPTLTLSENVVTIDGQFTASWAYVSTDGTAQSNAEICEAVVTSQGITYGNIIARTTSAQHVNILVNNVGWQTGSTHYLAVRVTSGSGKVSDNWSDPVPIVIADPLECEITQTSLQEMTIIDDYDEDEQPITRTIQALRTMPMTVTVTGAGTGGVTSVAIERSQDYRAIRPDESQFNGFEGESVFVFSQNGSDQIEITDESLIGNLDDGASYTLVATVSDVYGQKTESRIDFEVHWSHQAIIPEASVVFDYDDYIAKITPSLPEELPSGWTVDPGDVCDIYRLSADLPELIVQGGAFGTTYVDPFPAIGVSSGYRVVFRSVNGDYITEDNQFAWVDLVEENSDIFEPEDVKTIIDFDARRILLSRNVDVSNEWEKGFQETRYLGGSVQGDWNIAIGRTASVSATTITLLDGESIRDMRRLAAYAGICHIRTFDGTSMPCDIQVSEERAHDTYGHRVDFSMAVTRVDPEEIEGMTLAQWQEGQEEEE